MSRAPLSALRVFEAVARHGSFSRAADELCVTQSAVSHQVRALEDWFGTPLFRRSGNRATLAPHAEVLAAALGRSFDQIEAACRRARQATGPRSLTVAVIPSVAICWLIPRLGAFRARAPELEIRIVYAMHGQPVDLRAADVAVIYADGPPALAGFASVPFLPGTTAPVSAPHLGPPRDIDAMLAAGLLHDTDTSGWRSWLDAAGRPDLAVPPGPAFEDFNLLRAAALAGQGVALCPLAIIADDVAEGRLVRLAGPTIRDGCGYHVVTAPASEARDAPAVAAFRDWLLSTAPAGGAPASVAAAAADEEPGVARGLA